MRALNRQIAQERQLDFTAPLRELIQPAASRVVHFDELFVELDELASLVLGN
jgi:hypothetical protein